MTSPKKSRHSPGRAPRAVLGSSTAQLASLLGVAPATLNALGDDAKAAFLEHPATVDPSDPARWVFPPILVEKISALLSARMDAAAPAAEAAAPEAPPVPIPCDSRRDLRLTRIFPRSRHFLAEMPDGLEVVVAVPRSEPIDHCLPGMVLRSCFQLEHCWAYDGRLPRTLGERSLYLA